MFILSLRKIQCVTGKYNTRKVHTRLQPGLEGHIFQILTSEDIDNIISCFFTVVWGNEQSVKIVCLFRDTGKGFPFGRHKWTV